jgi:hypothetical protein
MPASRLSTSSRRSSSAFRRAAFGSVLTSLAGTIAKRRLPPTFTVTWSRPSDRFVIVPSPYATSRIVALEQQIQARDGHEPHAADADPAQLPRYHPAADRLVVDADGLGDLGDAEGAAVCHAARSPTTGMSCRPSHSVKAGGIAALSSFVVIQSIPIAIAHVSCVPGSIPLHAPPPPCGWP